nr:MAG TPA: hypothetical protein [Caudoviricetes sp.]DAN49157.1 MAG TPA: hypothetical protein [Caudoviricetes sp.]
MERAGLANPKITDLHVIFEKKGSLKIAGG